MEADATEAPPTGRTGSEAEPVFLLESLEFLPPSVMRLGLCSFNLVAVEELRLFHLNLSQGTEDRLHQVIFAHVWRLKEA